MEYKDIMRHHRNDIPAYLIWLTQQPNLGGYKQQFIQAVRDEAKKQISTPIKTSDVEVEILYSTSISRGSRADVDNITKPILDGLSAAAFDDDKQVRSLTSTVFQKTENTVVNGRIEHMGKLFHTSDKHVILIGVYSDSRLQELGGEDTVREKRMLEFLGGDAHPISSRPKWWQFWKR